MISSPAVRLPGGKYRAGSSNRQSLPLIHVTTEVFGIEGGRGRGEAGGKMGEGREESKKEEERREGQRGEEPVMWNRRSTYLAHLENDTGASTFLSF